MFPWSVRKHFESGLPTQLVAEKGVDSNMRQSYQTRLFRRLRILLEFITPPRWLWKPLKEEEIDPNHFNLGEFRWTHSEVVVKKEVLLYGPSSFGEDPCFVRTTIYIDGDPVSVETSGFKRYEAMAHLPDRYLRIRVIAECLSDGDVIDNGKNIVELSKEEKTLLAQYGSYRKLVRSFERKGEILELVRVLGTANRYRVVVRPLLEAELTLTRQRKGV